MSRPPLWLILLSGLGFVVVGNCATPPQPVPTPLPPLPFLCAGADSVPAFDAVANEVINAAMVEDDAGAAAALDAVAKKRRVSVVLCVIGEILPDLRNGAISGRHLEMWRADNAPVTVQLRASPWRRAFLVREGRPLYVVGI